jgi:hypothetical protein
MELLQELSIFWITLLVMLIGLIGLVIPMIPGITIIWLAALGYGVIRFYSGLAGWLDWVILGMISVLMVAGVTVDNLLMGAGAKQGGASWASLGLGAIAGLIGTLVFPPFGGLIAAPLIILLYEYSRHRDWQKAFTALRGLAAGWGLAFVIRFGLGVLMIILWVIWDWQATG